MTRLTVLLLPIALLACAPGEPLPVDGGAGSGAAPAASTAACDRYLSCVLVAAPQSYAAQLTLYGSDSECWQTARQAENCGMACDAAFEQIANQCSCTGATCTPPTGSCTDAHEPNDQLQLATPLALGVAITGGTCSQNDRDVYAFSLDDPADLEITVTASTAIPAAKLLNAAGTPLAATSPAGVAEVSHVLPGTYYVEVDATAQTNYELTVTAR